MRIHASWCAAWWMAAAIVPVLDAAEAPVAKPIELVLTARAVEQPLMKYRLLPAEYELQDGNAAPILLRLPWEQTKYFSTVVPTFQEYLDLPLDDPKLLASGGLMARFYDDLRRAAYRRTADWEYPLGEEPAAATLLPDVQGSRQIAGRGLSVWIRWRLARGELGEAQEGIKVGLAVSRHYAHTPFIVVQLVAASVDSMMLTRLEELLAFPDCPNLYWALTALPRPFVDIRPSVEFQQRTLEMSVDDLDDLERLHTDDAWQQPWAEVMRLCSGVPDTCSAPASSLDLAPPLSAEEKQLRERVVQRARRDLPSWMAADRVAAMSDAEAGLRWIVHRNREQSQQIAAMMSLEPPSAVAALRGLQNELASFSSELGSSLIVVKYPLNVYVSCHGVQRRIDALRAVEAIRHYAATHQGKLPESLDQIVDTPVPSDLLTGQPFHYEAAGDAAILSAPGIQIDGKAVGAIRYRLSIKK